MQKAKVIFSAGQGEATWKQDQYDATKRVAVIAVEADGKKYNLYAKEGTPAWTAAVGHELDIEVTAEPENGKYGRAKIPGTGGGGKAYVRRGFVQPSKEEAANACDYITLLHKALAARNPGLSNDAVATLTAAIFAKTC
jgi:hypothetical protein